LTRTPSKFSESTLITGGTGFIGAQVVRVLLEKGEKGIVVFDINPSTKLLDDVAVNSYPLHLEAGRIGDV